MRSKQAVFSLLTLSFLGALAVIIFIASGSRQIIFPRAATPAPGTGAATNTGGTAAGGAGGAVGTAPVSTTGAPAAACTITISSFTPLPTVNCNTASQYVLADYSCSDGSTATVGDGVTCKSYAELKLEASTTCLNKCASSGGAAGGGTTPPTTGGGTNTGGAAGGSIPSCPEGIKSTTYKPCSSTSPSGPFLGALVTCYDDSTVDVALPPVDPNAGTRGCQPQSILDAYIASLNLCVGKKSASCSGGLSPTPGPTGTTTTLCKTKAICDCNCDGVTDITTDFECWRKQYVGEASCSSADFNSDNKCSLADFECIRKNAL